jgi:hypothetical protein
MHVLRDYFQGCHETMYSMDYRKPEWHLYKFVCQPTVPENYDDDLGAYCQAIFKHLESPVRLFWIYTMIISEFFEKL